MKKESDSKKKKILDKEGEWHLMYVTLWNNRRHSRAEFSTCFFRGSWILLEWKYNPALEGTQMYLFLHKSKFLHEALEVLSPVIPVTAGNRGIPVPFLFFFTLFFLHFLYLSENKEQVLSVQVFQKTILWIIFFNSNLQFSVPATQRKYRRKSYLQSSCLPSRLLFLTTTTGLWPLIHLKCSWVLLFCQLLWCSEHTTSFSFSFFSSHFTCCSTFSFSSQPNPSFLEGRSQHSLPPS